MFDENAICQVCGQTQRVSVTKEWDPFQNHGKESAKVEMLLTHQTVTGECPSYPWSTLSITY